MLLSLLLVCLISSRISQVPVSARPLRALLPQRLFRTAGKKLTRGAHYNVLL